MNLGIYYERKLLERYVYLYPVNNFMKSCIENVQMSVRLEMKSRLYFQKIFLLFFKSKFTFQS